MTKTYEQKLLVNILYDTRRIFKDDKSITENYYDCWCYLNDIIDSVLSSPIDESIEKVAKAIIIEKWEVK